MYPRTVYQKYLEIMSHLSKYKKFKKVYDLSVLSVFM